MVKPELLAPAGDFEGLNAALAAGCDGVYLGLQAFGARASAKNFDIEDLKKARDICSFFNVKMYATVNTLIKQSELNQLKDVLDTVAEVGLDAVIVQDIGVAQIIKNKYPNLALHASTQLAIHSSYGAKFLKDFGFKRVVLARECSLDTIKAVAATGIETEIFVHGALCVSMSGQCLLSSFAGGRSGNRGRCAQPCRQELIYDNKKAMWLSTRDIMLYDSLPSLIEAGVTSFKIEGRMKRPAYVSQVLSQYKKGIDSALKGAFKPLNNKEKQDIAQLFNRGEFSSAYVANSEDLGIINPERSNHGGIYIGDVLSTGKKLIEISLSKAVADGDGLQIRTGGNQEKDIDIIYSGKSGDKGDVIKAYVRPGTKVSSGMQIFRLTSEEQMQNLKSLKRDDVPLSVKAILLQNKAAKLIVKDDFVEFEAEGDVCQTPKTQALSEDKIKENLLKTADMPIKINDISIVTDGVFMPVSALNNLRRTAYEGYMAKRIAFFTNTINVNNYSPQNPDFIHKQREEIYFISNDIEAGEYAQSKGAIFVYEPLDIREKFIDNYINKLNKASFILLPTQLNDKNANILMQAIYKANLNGLMLDNIGQLGLDISKYNITLGTHVPLINNMALKAIEEYNPKAIGVFPELNFNEFKDIKSKDVPFAIKVYGRERLMILNHCPARTALGLSSGKEKCTMCHEGKKQSLLNKTFTDRKGEVYPLRALYNDDYCVVEMYNSQATSLHKNIDSFKGMGKIIHCTFESTEQQIDIFNAFYNENFNYFDIKTTQGHFDKGVI